MISEAKWIARRLCRRPRALAMALTALCVGSGGACWAGQTVNVTPGQNLQTLVNQYPPGTTFSLAAGTYRLQSIVPQNYDSFVGQAGAILSGAALLSAFSPSGAYWTAAVQATQAPSYPGQCNAASPACTLPEDLFFNNAVKTRVTSLGAVGPGKWYLDYSTGTVYLGDNPSGYTVEISLARYAFSGPAASVTITNLTIEKYACLAQSGAIEGSGSTYWVAGGNEIRYNHGRGISTGNGMYLYNDNVHHNGQLGVGGSGANVLLQNDQISYNNYAGYSYYWEAGGAKFANVQHLTIQYSSSQHNVGPGFWNDANSQYVTYNANQASNNAEAGIMSSTSSNVTISNNYIWDDGYNADGTGIWWGAGILVVDSSTVAITGNTVANCMDGIGEILSNQGNAPNGQPYLLKNVGVSGNTLYQTTGMAAGIAVEGSGFDNSVYTSWNNTFQGNTYNLANPSGNYFYWLGQTMNLATFTGDAGGGGGSPGISLAPASVAFGSCPVEMGCSSQTVTLTNTGSAALSIANIAVTGADPADYTENNTCNSSVAAGARCTIAILFTPLASGSRAASLAIADNAGGSPQSAALAGAGTHDVILTWTGSGGSGLAGYNIYRGTTSQGESNSPLNSSPIAGTNYTDSNVQAGTKYYYVLTAVFSNGSQSAGSNEASATVPSP